MVTDGAGWLKTCSLHQETLLKRVLAHVRLKQNRDCPMPQVECSDNPDDMCYKPYYWFTTTCASLYALSTTSNMMGRM